MSYNPKLHKRHSIQLKKYDYRQDGLYFLTICLQKHICRFGRVVEDKMVLNEAGEMTLKWWTELAHKFQQINLYNFGNSPACFRCIN